MSTIAYDAQSPWANYHLTASLPGRMSDYPQICIEDSGRVHCSDVADLPGLLRFNETRKILQNHLKRVVSRVDKDPDGAVYAAGLVGRGWSFSPLIGNEKSQLHLDGLAGCSAVNPADLHANCAIPSSKIALVSGGTRIAEIVDWAARRNLTVHTSGTHLGPTIAGGFGTASHGSKIGYGGLQNSILGIHLITGPNKSVWLERASRPVLKDAVFAHGSPNLTETELKRDDAMFEDVLIHLGGMGIVNGVAIELTENRPFGLLRKAQPLSGEWMEKVAHGDFRGLANYLGYDALPAFYEVTIDPMYHPESDALHTMYFQAPPGATASDEDAGLLGASDAIIQLTEMLPKGIEWKTAISSPLWGPLLMGGPGNTPFKFDAALFSEQVERKNACKTPNIPPSAFIAYRVLGGFDDPRFPFQAAGADPSHYNWRGLHQGEITTGNPGALYNASFAINCAQLPLALAAICEATKILPPTFLFTVRFVSNAEGTLAFTRFPQCAVIEIDGVSPLYWKWQEIAFPDLKPQFDKAANAVSTGALLVRAALDKVNIDYSMHWAKLGMLNPEKVESDYGPTTDPQSPISRWRRTRSNLLGAKGELLFWNDALVQYGLVKRPPDRDPPCKSKQVAS
jgi:hypothetical protein